MALPTWVGQTGFEAASGGAISPSFASTGRTSGDLLVLAFETANEAVNTPSGWTQITNSPIGSGIAGDPGSVRLTVFYKISDGTETTVTSSGPANHITGRGFVVRGVHAASPIHITANGTSGSGVIVYPSVTTTVEETFVMMITGYDRDALSTDGIYSGLPTNSNLANITKRSDETSNLGAGGGIGLITATKAATGSLGTSTVGTGTSHSSANITLAVAPPEARKAVRHTYWL